MPGGGARGQNLVHLQKLGFLCKSFLDVNISESIQLRLLLEDKSDQGGHSNPDQTAIRGPI